MTQQLGWAPVLADQSGEVYVDTNQMVGGDGEESGSVHFPFGRHAADRRFSRQMGRYEAAVQAPTAQAPVTTAELYQQAAATGILKENQFFGLGAVGILAASNGVLTQQINRNLWGKALVLESDAPAFILVDQINIAGIPWAIGNAGAPLSMWSSVTTRHGISFGRKIGLTGQAVFLQFTNGDPGSGHQVSAGMVVDEINPDMMQNIMERLFLTAATGHY